MSHLFAAVVIGVVAIILAVIRLELIADLGTFNDQTVCIANNLTCVVYFRSADSCIACLYV